MRIEKETNLDELPKMKETSKQAIANEKEEESELAATLKQTNTRIEQIESVQPNKQKQPNQQYNTQPQPYQQVFSQNQFRGRGYNRGERGFGQTQHQSTPLIEFNQLNATVVLETRTLPKDVARTLMSMANL